MKKMILTLLLLLTSASTSDLIDEKAYNKINNDLNSIIDSASIEFTETLKIIN